MKRVYIFIGIFSLIVTVVLVARFIFGGNENTWICENGEWVKHGNPMISKPSKGCGEELDDITKILVDLKGVVGGGFSEISESEFEWRVEREKNEDVIKTDKSKILGMQIESGNLSEGQIGLIAVYFYEKGFLRSLYNVFPGYQETVGGYQKGDIVCLVTQVNQDEKKMENDSRIQISCGKLVNGEEENSTSQIANPAAVYCKERGGSLRYEEVEAGTKGICVFEDGSECEEWAYFRGECP